MLLTLYTLTLFNYFKGSIAWGIKRINTLGSTPKNYKSRTGIIGTCKFSDCLLFMVYLSTTYARCNRGG